MPDCSHKHSLSIGVDACLLWALMLLVLPLQWLISALLAAMLHESGHLLTLRLCGGKIGAVHIHRFGARIQASSLSAGKAILCTLAGPVFGFLPLLFMDKLPLIAICAAVHSCYNLLPLSCLDGGNALYETLHFCCPNAAIPILRIVQTACLLLLWLLVILMVILRFFSPLPLIILLALTHSAKKDLANKAANRYNRMHITKGVRL